MGSGATGRIMQRLELTVCCGCLLCAHLLRPHSRSKYVFVGALGLSCVSATRLMMCCVCVQLL